MRSIGIGMIMGGTTSALQTVQAKVGEMRTASEQAAETRTGLGEVADVGMAMPVPSTEEIHVDAGEAADVELPQVIAPERGGSWSSLWSWISGTGR
jgi:hypothetical protein